MGDEVSQPRSLPSPPADADPNAVRQILVVLLFVKIDYYLPPDFPHRLDDVIRTARHAGFDGVFSADVSHDPFLPLLRVTQLAPSMTIGTAIAVAFARSPMTLAQTAYDLAGAAEGRFLLGLGTQIRPHIVHRFSMPWSAPVPRMREYVAAMRAIWHSWQSGERLRFRGEHYHFSLMTPFFDPGPIEGVEVPVYLAGVGTGMATLTGEIADGFHAHPFHTVEYLDDVVLPAITAGAETAGRSLDDVSIVSTVMCVTGRNEAEMAEASRAVRQQIAFYASTPAYRAVLDLHDWDFGDRLLAMSKAGEWDAMSGVISDEVLEQIAVVAPLDELAGAIRDRYGDRLDRVGFYNVGPGFADLTIDEWASLVEGLRSIPDG